MSRPPGRATPLLVVAALLVLLGAGNAHAAGYRYWSFWEGDGGKGWTYATQGPSSVRPDDGAVQGFRFSVSEDSRDAAQPRRAPDFGTVCADTPQKDGLKRIALVIDPGTAADAPDGEQAPASAHRLRPGRTGREHGGSPRLGGEAAAVRQLRDALRHLGLPALRLR